MSSWIVKTASLFLRKRRPETESAVTSSSIWLPSDEGLLDGGKVLDQGRLDEAEVILMDIFHNAPTQRRNLENLARLAEARRNWPLAIRWLNRIQFDPEGVWQRELLISGVLARQGRQHRAFSLLEKIIRDTSGRPGASDAMYWSSTLLDFFLPPYREKAFHFFDSLLNIEDRLKGSTTSSLRIRAKIARLQGKWEEANNYLLEAIILRPNDAEIRDEQRKTASGPHKQRGNDAQP